MREVLIFFHNEEWASSRACCPNRRSATVLGRSNVQPTLWPGIAKDCVSAQVSYPLFRFEQHARKETLIDSLQAKTLVYRKPLIRVSLRACCPNAGVRPSSVAAT